MLEDLISKWENIFSIQKRNIKIFSNEYGYFYEVTSRKWESLFDNEDYNVDLGNIDYLNFFPFIQLDNWFKNPCIGNTLKVIKILRLLKYVKKDMDNLNCNSFNFIYYKKLDKIKNDVFKDVVNGIFETNSMIVNKKITDHLYERFFYEQLEYERNL